MSPLFRLRVGSGNPGALRGWRWIDRRERKPHVGDPPSSVCGREGWSFLLTAPQPDVIRSFLSVVQRVSDVPYHGRHCVVEAERSTSISPLVGRAFDTGLT
jgi:hypothetical protein